MLTRIADLIVEIPDAGDLIPRCQDYLFEGTEDTIGADIIIRTEFFRMNQWPNLTEDQIIYMESGAFFKSKLLAYGGTVLHASAVEKNGKAYLFSAPCGTGKSTHTKLWQSIFADAVVFNDDKPAIRMINETWYAYGTPWCGKDGINQNIKVPIAGICFLKQASCNKIRRLDDVESVHKLLWQTSYQFNRVDRLDMMLGLIENLVNKIPCYELENKPESEAVLLSYETMRRTAEELGL